MQATPQQVGGGSLYSHKTRLGNWQEEIAIGESKLENFRKRSETGSLALRKQEIKIQRCNEIVPHTFNSDGMIRFGDTLVLQHNETGAILGCDPFEEIVQGAERYLVCGSSQDVEPKARYTFRVARCPKRIQDIGEDESDPFLKYGQSFVLECSESLLISQTSQMLNPQLYVASCKKNERTATRNTNRQMMFMSPRCDADAVWQCVPPSKGRTNASERFLMLGEPVAINDILQLTHRQTNQYLTIDKGNKFESVFGIEMECYCDRAALAGKLGLMVSEFKGESTATTLAKPDAPCFGWHFVGATDAGAAVDTRDVLPPSATTEQITSEVFMDVKSRGVDGFWNLRAFFMALDKKAMNVGKIDREDLKDALQTWGTSVEPRYLDKIIDVVDNAKTGLVPWRDFIAHVRDCAGPLSEARETSIMEAFATIDTVGTGRVSVDDVSFCFYPNDHPLVTVAELSHKDALSHMLLSMANRGRLPENITYEQFSDYFQDLSACVEDDQYFDAVIKSIWRR